MSSTARPVILVTEPSADVRNRLAEVLWTRYLSRYRVMTSATPTEAQQLLTGLTTAGQRVALVMVRETLPPDSGAEQVCKAAHKADEDTSRLLIRSPESKKGASWVPNWADDTAFEPDWSDPDAVMALLTATDEQLASGSDVGVIVLGRRRDPDSRRIKDFLARNYVLYRYYDRDHDEVEVARIRAKFKITETSKPVVVVIRHQPRKSEVLIAPKPVEVAKAVGLVTPMDRTKFFDVVVVGGGPAGLAAAIYAGYDGRKVAIVEDDAPGGQSGSTSMIENYLGFPDGIGGADLAHRALRQAHRLGVSWAAERATAVTRDTSGGGFAVATGSGTALKARSVVVATGMKWNLLGYEKGKFTEQGKSVRKLLGRGVYYGAPSIVEAKEASGTDVFVVGSGNSAAQAAVLLAENYANVSMLVRGSTFDRSKLSDHLAKRIAKLKDRITVLLDTEIDVAIGDDALTGIRLKVRNKRAGTVPADALYLLVGSSPNTEFVGKLVHRDRKGAILTGYELEQYYDETGVPRPLHAVPMLMCETSCPGVFAVGDCRAGAVTRIGAAVGQGALVANMISRYLHPVAPKAPPKQQRAPELAGRR